MADRVTAEHQVFLFRLGGCSQDARLPLHCAFCRMSEHARGAVKTVRQFSRRFLVLCDFLRIDSSPSPARVASGIASSAASEVAFGRPCLGHSLLSESLTGSVLVSTRLEGCHLRRAGMLP